MNIRRSVKQWAQSYLSWSFMALVIVAGGLVECCGA